MIEYSTVFKVGHDEAETVWAKGWNAEQYSEHFHEANKALVVVTRAGEGAIAFDGHQLISHPGYHVELVDPIGAGDAFMAGFLAGILEEGTVSEFFDLDAPSRAHVLNECLEVANVCGALVCTRHGDTAAMPTMAGVRAFQQDYLPD
jgi:sugar/nucleoside kinase (ribokinase family)